ncbi:hypothetical protein SODALDRAFT_358948 [Sodiomyces alkalinus F11]|uniref:Uncharacterized protein n=1 Tax=Sodiomyces alkalinus (strain CBS 110278 / VKM F-3762 / F11) TaxID=1314773 RepID=A0A3N2PXE0_SODAK|nr:hypothetical protein SODALDRAFT_358948 [Sodiomyces alkalinus F11]ROT39086.1 hypothetical protein SODALDRAFT_358948 [Sodiomyces alkalinus F11]
MSVPTAAIIDQLPFEILTEIVVTLVFEGFRKLAIRTPCFCTAMVIFPFKVEQGRIYEWADSSEGTRFYDFEKLLYHSLDEISSNYRYDFQQYLGGGTTENRRTVCEQIVISIGRVVRQGCHPKIRDFLDTVTKEGSFSLAATPLVPFRTIDTAVATEQLTSATEILENILKASKAWLNRPFFTAEDTPAESGPVFYNSEVQTTLIDVWKLALPPVKTLIRLRKI